MTAGGAAAGPAEEVSAPAAGSCVRPRCGARGLRGRAGLEAAPPTRARVTAAAAEAREQRLGSSGRSAFMAFARRLPCPRLRRPRCRRSRRRRRCLRRGCPHGRGAGSPWGPVTCAAAPAPGWCGGGDRPGLDPPELQTPGVGPGRQVSWSLGHAAPPAPAARLPRGAPAAQ